MNDSTLLIEPHYLGSLEYFVLIRSFKKIRFDVHAHYTKQSFKNRTEFLSTNGPLALTIPVKYHNRTPLKEVRVDYSGSWLREHWGAFYSAYGKAPFFEFFADGYREIWERKQSFLVDLNMDMMSLCLHLLQYDRTFEFTEVFEKAPNADLYDIREQIHPKKPFEEGKIYLPFPYTQVFGNNFVPNLSIVDLLMCEGNRADEVLRESTSDANEHL